VDMYATLYGTTTLNVPSI